MTTDDPDTANAPPPGGRWAFDEGVTAAFEDMLSKSIPLYPAMRELTTNVAIRLMEDGDYPFEGMPRVLDLGTSRGDALAPIVERFGDEHARFEGIEVSPPMLEAARDRFASDDRVSIDPWDLRDGLPPQARVESSGRFPDRGRYRAVLAVLTVMFVPIEYRPRLLRQVYEALEPGGAFLLVEKVLGSDHRAQEVLVDVYHQGKRDVGYSPEAIDRKRLSLEGVLVPSPAEVHELALRRAGFETVECYFAALNFRGWMAVKAR